MPDAYCVYRPLAAASIADVMETHDNSIQTKLHLFCDYLSGLAYLHEQKGIIHHDIKPANLVITSLSNPRGVIIDLDSASWSRSSTDHMKGTVSYLAPEVIALKQGHRGNSFDNKVDVWALGVSIYQLDTGRSMPWQATPGFITEAAFKEFDSLLKKKISYLKAKPDKAKDKLRLAWVFNTAIRTMIMFDPKTRSSAIQHLHIFQELTTKFDRGVITLKSQKRKLLE